MCLLSACLPAAYWITCEQRKVLWDLLNATELKILRALTFDNVRYSAVKQILEKGLDQQPDESSTFDTLSDAYTGGGRFHQEINKLLPH